MSDGGRERAFLALEVWKSSQKWSEQRSAVRSIAWLAHARPNEEATYYDLGVAGGSSFEMSTTQRHCPSESKRQTDMPRRRRVILRERIERLGPLLLKLGLGFSLFVALLPSVYWGVYWLLFSMHIIHHTPKA